MVWASCALESACVVKAGVSIHYDSSARHGHWWQRHFPRWEPTTFHVFRHFVRPDAVVLDVGGWIGTTAVWLAAVARKVVVLEPAEAAFEEMQKHVAKNPDRRHRLSLLRAALGPRRGFVHMTNYGDSADQVAMAGGSLTSMWDIRELLSAFPDLEEVSLVKIDAEGSERDIIPALAEFLKQTRPVLLVSLHPYALMDEELAVLVSQLRVICPYLYGFYMVNGTWMLADFQTPMSKVSGGLPQVADPADDALCIWQPAPLDFFYDLET
ncbi:unnamed protein product [Cladocopium goreaui]|uniref:Methyltransferase FkbM domain-containing protein n=1 Tax=Cladocopium goreaui TaxID=2562237 RepID=A0A9P1M5H1_9DINO|nr:unnamed protein product [Cladocopium goreaui]